MHSKAFLLNTLHPPCDSDSPPKKACSSKKHTFEDAVQQQQLPLHDVAKLFCFTFQPDKHLEDADVQRVAGSWLTDTSTKNKKKLWHNKNSFNRYLDSRFVEASLDDFQKNDISTLILRFPVSELMVDCCVNICIYFIV